MEYTEFKYSLKVWLTSVVVAPVIMIICDYAITSALPPPPYQIVSDFSFGYLALVVFGGIFSIPTYIFFYLFIKITVNCNYSMVRMKSIISLLGIGLTAGTFELFFSIVDHGLRNPLFYLMIGNCLCIGWFSWFYKLATQESQTAK